MIDFNEDYVGVAGDWHGDKAWAKSALYTLADYGVTVVLHVGDFGFWPGNSGQKYLHYVNKILVEKSMTLFVTLGNHEDYVQISTFSPHPEFEGFVYDKNFPNIIVAKRGTRWEWQGVSFMSLGGANSIDFTSRTEWINWWSAEQISMADVYNSIEGGHVDVMITHDSPYGVPIFGTHKDEDDSSWSETALNYAVQSRHAMRVVVDAVKPNILIHGHYHVILDVVATLNDGQDDYDIRNVCLDMNSSRDGNIAIFNLNTQDIERVDVEWKYLAEFYKKNYVKSGNTVIKM